MTPTSASSTEVVRLIYRSRASLDGTASGVERELAAILERARARNAIAGITGALMFTRLMFVQVLEGPAEAVEATFERICRDLRHTDLEVLEYGAFAQRGFGDWSMRHLVPNAEAEVLFEDVTEAEEAGDVALSALRMMRALLGSTAEDPVAARRSVAA